jgi:hypothetical protein
VAQRRRLANIVEVARDSNQRVRKPFLENQNIICVNTCSCATKPGGSGGGGGRACDGGGSGILGASFRFFEAGSMATVTVDKDLDRAIRYATKQTVRQDLVCNVSTVLESH